MVKGSSPSGRLSGTTSTSSPRLGRVAYCSRNDEAHRTWDSGGGGRAGYCDIGCGEGQRRIQGPQRSHGLDRAFGTLAATFLLLGKNTDEATEAQTRFQNRSNLLIDELDRQNEALQGQIKLLDLRKAALLSGDDASEGRNVQRLELQRLGDEIEVQAAAAEAARAKLNKGIVIPTGE